MYIFFHSYIVTVHAIEDTFITQRPQKQMLLNSGYQPQLLLKKTQKINNEGEFDSYPSPVFQVYANLSRTYLFLQISWNGNITEI